MNHSQILITCIDNTGTLWSQFDTLTRDREWKDYRRPYGKELSGESVSI